MDADREDQEVVCSRTPPSSGDKKNENKMEGVWQPHVSGTVQKTDLCSPLTPLEKFEEGEHFSMPRTSSYSGDFAEFFHRFISDSVSHLHHPECHPSLKRKFSLPSTPFIMGA
ncbi:hypothetical protein CDAR_93771 [Caerostris darwini]|uniref:Uncharacterized protein n=1 Tax=Caerostris darwini TaxID=1538125 RepID=A0AAV4NND6_9ARAC|nr:hypothetical protein CDAR_93771 [Caerostris darwini]